LVVGTLVTVASQVTVTFFWGYFCHEGIEIKKEIMYSVQNRDCFYPLFIGIGAMDMKTNNDKHLGKPSHHIEGKKPSIWKNISLGILGFLSLILGRSFSNTPSVGTSVTGPVMGLTPQAPPESPTQGQTVPQIKMEIDGNIFIVNSVPERITLEKNVVEKITNGETTIEKVIGDRTIIEFPDSASPITNTPTVTVNDVLTSVTTWVNLSIALIGLVIARQELKGNKSKSAMYIFNDSRKGVFITINSDAKNVTERLKEIIPQGEVVILNDVEIIDSDDKKNTSD
jgi:hypothetical protein